MRQVTVGPTAVMAIMTRKYVDKGGVQYAIVLSFLAGCVELAAGLLNLGALFGNYKKKKFFFFFFKDSQIQLTPFCRSPKIKIPVFFLFSCKLSSVPVMNI